MSPMVLWGWKRELGLKMARNREHLAYFLVGSLVYGYVM